MATRRELQAVEESVQRLLRDNGLAPPDEVEYWETSIACLWHETKTCVVIEVDEPREGYEGE